MYSGFIRGGAFVFERRLRKRWNGGSLASASRPAAYLSSDNRSEVAGLTFLKPTEDLHPQSVDWSE